MGRSFRIVQVLVAGVLLGSAGTVEATGLGLNTDPAGSAWNRGDENSAHVTWDSFPGFQFSNDGPDASFGLINPALSQVGHALSGDMIIDQGGGVYDNVSTRVPGDDVLHTGGYSPTFTATGSTPFGIKQFFLQLKRTAGDINLAPTLNGLSADGVTSITGTGDTTHSTTGYRVTTYAWDQSIAGLDITDFTVSFTTTSHFPLDAVVIDAGVPEPAALGLLGVGGLGMLWRRRRH